MKQERFAIRKTARGAVSARIAVIGLLALFGVGQEAQADSLTTGVASTMSATGDTTSEEKRETIVIASPVSYIADETKELGVTEVTQQGQDGKLVITGDLSDKIVNRQEATETIAVVGTKPSVEETIIETDQTAVEYVADDQLAAGEKNLVQEAQDGKQITTTTYKVVTKEDPRTGFAPLSYKYEVPYRIDNSQKLDSDKVIVDEGVIREELATYMTDEQWGQVLRESFGVLNHHRSFRFPALDFEVYRSNYFAGQELSPEHLAAIKAAYIRYQAALEYIQGKYHGQELVTFFNDHVVKGYFDEQETTYTVGLRPSDQRRDTTIPLLHTHTIVDNYQPTFTALAKLYLTHLSEQGIYPEDTVADSPTEITLDGIKYAILTSSSSAVMESAADLTLDQMMEKYHRLTGMIHTAYETWKKRYDNSRDEAGTLNIVYETSRMPAEEKVWFEEKLASLPNTIKRHLLKVTIRDEGEKMANGGTSVGMAYPSNGEIHLNYPDMGSKERLLKVFLHELSHVIDYHGWGMSGSASFYGYRDGFMDRGYLPVASDLKTSIYNTYINPTIDKETNLTVRPYYRDYVHESFAEFFSDYIFTRHFPEYKPVKFIEVDGKVLTLRDMDWGKTPEEIAENRANYEQYYNDPAAYAPAKAAEWFFAYLYTKLFEVPVIPEIVIDQVKTEVLDAKHKIVQVGTKPTIVKEVTAYTTLEVEDTDLLIGERKVIQAGRNGIKQIVTTYELMDKTTGEVKATTNDELVQEMVQEIIAIGKKKSQSIPITTDQTVEQSVSGNANPVEQNTSTNPPVEKSGNDLSVPRNQLLSQVDQSRLTDEQKGELAVKIAFAETAEELDKLKADLTSLTAPASQPASADKPATADKPVPSAAKTLPTTGELSTETLTAMGLSLVLFSLGLAKARKIK